MTTVEYSTFNGLIVERRVVISCEFIGDKTIKGQYKCIENRIITGYKYVKT